MSSLRLIILFVGLAFIAVIYFWETIKQKRQQRRQMIKRAATEREYSDIRINREQDTDIDISDVLSELNQSLSDTDQKAELKKQERMVVADKEAEFPEPAQPAGVHPEPETRDMFADTGSETDTNTGRDTDVNQEIDQSRIISLHVTALPARAFAGNDILSAVNEVGLEYGEMNIFHHYGVGDMRCDKPLFSLADMFEPGYFDLAELNRHNTRGLTLFLCLPSPVDGQVVFELMLNTAQRLAHQLGGEIRGSGQDLIDDEQIAEIRNRINQYAYT